MCVRRFVHITRLKSDPKQLRCNKTCLTYHSQWYLGGLPEIVGPRWALGAGPLWSPCALMGPCGPLGPHGPGPNGRPGDPPVEATGWGERVPNDRPGPSTGGIPGTHMLKLWDG